MNRVVPFDTTQITSKGNYSRPKAGDPCHPLAAGAHAPAVAQTLRVGGREQGAGDSYDNTPVVAQTITAEMYRSGGATAGNNPGVRNVFAVGFDEFNGTTATDHHTLRAGTKQSTGAVQATVPRRLTPRECERLQGWPDDWTRFGTTPDGEVVELSDSARYRMAGNGVSAPVAEWIGRRLMQSVRAAHHTNN